MSSDPTTTSSSPMEQLVFEAASAVVKSTIEAQARSTASAFLDQWSRTPEAWTVFHSWLRLSLADAKASLASLNGSSSSSLANHNNRNDADSVGMQLLCLQMIPSKVRREIPRAKSLAERATLHPTVGFIHTELVNFLRDLTCPLATPLSGPACVCLAAISVRGAALPELIPSCCHALIQHVTTRALPGAATLLPYLSQPSAPPLLPAGGESPAVHPWVALRLLTNIPLEVDTCQDLMTRLVVAELLVYMPAVQDTLRQVILSEVMQGPTPIHHPHSLAASNHSSLVSSNSSSSLSSSYEILVEALDALETWARVSHICISQLDDHTTWAGSSGVLAVLMYMLTQPPPDQAEKTASSLPWLYHEKVMVKACQALTESILIENDACTQSRHDAVQKMFESVPSHGFCINAWKWALAQGWEDACLALAVFMTTLIREDVDEIAVEPNEAVIAMLLQFQNHPTSYKVRGAMLDCWLTVQEVALCERDELWRQPLYRRLVHGLVTVGLIYPAHFQDWDQEVEVEEADFDDFQEVEVEEADFDDFRDSSQDVLVGSYYLLRADFVQFMVQTIVGGPGGAEANQPPSWNVQESALFALKVTAGDVNPRIKSRGGGTSLSMDRERTKEQLWQLVQYLCLSDLARPGQNGASPRHPRLVAGIANFLAAYAPSWAILCSAQNILQLLGYLTTVLSTYGGPGTTTTPRMDAANAVRSLLVVCTDTLLSDTFLLQGPLLHWLKGTLDASLAANHEEAVVVIIEGCTRLIMQMKDPFMISDCLRHLIDPLVQRGKYALNAVVATNGNSTSSQVAKAVEALDQTLQLVQVIIRFCDNVGDGSHATAAITELLGKVWPLLERVSHQMTQHTLILERVLTIHEQLLKNVPDMISPYFQATLLYVVGVFGSTKSVNALSYLTSAVDIYGNDGNTELFENLLTHVTSVVFTFFQELRVRDWPDVVQAYFELLYRYLLCCPAALVSGQHLVAIISSAIECLSACEGEKESTRAILQFLKQLFAWRQLRKSPTTMNLLQNASPLLDNQLRLHGAFITRMCMQTMLAGPQTLYPCCEECLFVILCTAIAMPNPEDPTTSLPLLWMRQAIQPEPIYAPVYERVVNSILESASTSGLRSKYHMTALLDDYFDMLKGDLECNPRWSLAEA